MISKATPLPAPEVTAELDRSIINSAGNSVRHLVVTVRAPERKPDPDKQRPPLNIGLVIDASGSMSGAPLDAAKLAALDVISALDPTEHMSLVSFADDAVQHATAVLLADDGRHVSIAVQGGAQATIPIFEIMRRRLTLTGSTLRARDAAFKGLVADELHKTVWPHVEAGRLKPVIDRSFPLVLGHFPGQLPKPLRGQLRLRRQVPNPDRVGDQRDGRPVDGNPRHTEGPEPGVHRVTAASQSQQDVGG